MSFFLSPFNYTSPVSCADITSAVVYQLNAVGVESTADPQRIQAVQRYGTCEMKSALAVLSHSMPEIAYQIFRTALLEHGHRVSENLDLNDMWSTSGILLPDSSAERLDSLNQNTAQDIRQIGRQATQELSRRLAKSIDVVVSCLSSEQQTT